MQNLALQIILLQVGKNLHRSSQRIAFARRQEVELLTFSSGKRGEKTTEDALSATRSNKDETQRITTEVSIITASKIVFNRETFEKLTGHSTHSLLVMELGGEGIDGYTFHNLFFFIVLL